MQWQPPFSPPGPAPGSAWLPASIIGSAVVLAAGLVGGALIVRGDGGAGEKPTTCQAWAETRQALRAVPPLPDGWSWTTPSIDTLVRFQNGPVAFALDHFEPHISPQPPEVSQAARDYVSAQRNQMAALDDRSYVPADGAAVDTALARLNMLCGIPDDSQPA